MDASKRRSQTTKGIWLARCAGIEHCTLVMDLEGTDGRERGEDDTAFEKQSALFALAISDIVLINLWCHDIGREQAANKPLLKTVFQVMMRMFRPRKTTLMFVIRDKTRAPLDILESDLREEMQKVWNSVPKPQQAHRETPLSEFFNVLVVALPSYEYEEQQFKEQAASLRQRFYNFIAPGDRHDGIPASVFSLHAKKIWEDIKENKDLNLPSYKVMVATIRCEEIANEKFSSFAQNKAWCVLKEAVQSGPVSGFGKKLSSILETSLSGFIRGLLSSRPIKKQKRERMALVTRYDTEVLYFDEGVRSAKREQLQEKLLQLVQPAFQSMLGHIRSGTLNKFKKGFDKALSGGEGFFSAACQCSKDFMALFDKECADLVIQRANWNTSKVRDELQHCIDDHIASVRAAKLAELEARSKPKLFESLSKCVGVCLKNADDDTWPDIRKLIRRETESALSSASGELSCFVMDEETKEKTFTSLENYAKGVVEAKAREEAQMVLMRMKERFILLFCFDCDSNPREWARKRDIREMTKIVYSMIIKLLSVMAVVRLDDKTTDAIENVLFYALVDPESSTSAKNIIPKYDPLASDTWEQVPSSKTLITPVLCKFLWEQFLSETKDIIDEAFAAQKARKHKKLLKTTLKVGVFVAGVAANALGFGLPDGGLQ